jgi:DNA-binding MarR family transcriptional regulator
MKVFISWSGVVSHRVALSFRDWLPVVLPFIEPWVSSEDIPKGTRWSTELAGELEDTQAGIICLVPGNLTEPWLNFEAGALSKSVTTARIHPFLLGIEPGELPGPLAQFQATCFSKDELRKLINALNIEAGSSSLSDKDVERGFNTCWPSLESQLTVLLVEVKNDGGRAEADTTKAEEDVTAEAITILKIVANSPGSGPKEIAERMGVHHQRTRHIMEDLQDKKLLTRYTSSMGGFVWSLSKGGRAFLVKKNLL